MIRICIVLQLVYLSSSVPAGLEPATYRLTADRSNQLSYGTKKKGFQNSCLLQIRSAAPPIRFINMAVGIFERVAPYQV